LNRATLTIFANFRIDNEERYQRMKDSFKSFKEIEAQKWVINVRGFYKLKTILFLREQLGEKLYPNLIESGKGWFHDTKEMLPLINTDFVLFWIEDHINLVDIKKYDDILVEMKENSVDHLFYSWWHDGTKSKFKSINKIETNNLNIYNLNLNNIKIIEKKTGKYFYTVSAVSISSLFFFKKIINTNYPILKRWPKETPFDFEKRSTDLIFLPFRLAIPRCELFANIDDDHGNDGYSLISRGLYRNTMSREEIKSIEFNKKNSKFVIIKNLIPSFLLKYVICIYSIARRVKLTWID